MEITYEDFRKVQIRVGTVLSLRNNEKARQPALVLEVDFGENIGVKTSSAKITHYYNSENLVGKQIIAVCNFPTKNIADIILWDSSGLENSISWNFKWIKLIPNNVINSFLSAEDKNFFKHPGIDAKGVTRAIIKNVRNYLKSKRLEGASTITQQVAKNFLLSNEVTLNRKIKEAILAFRIERALSKERILELYLNQIYLGQGAYGIAAASLEYFDKPINKLRYEEAALLAALPKAPTKYNPFKSNARAKKRRNLVLKNLYENQGITLSFVHFQ